MKAEKLRTLLRNRTKIISVKLNPELVQILDKTLEKDKEIKSRNEFFERAVIDYLERKKAFEI